MMRYQRLPLRVKIAAVGGIVLLLLLVSIGLNSASQRRFLATDQEKEQELAVTRQTDSLLLALVDMETGVRGYVITGNREFLEPYASGMATYPVSLSRLEALLAGRPAQLDRVARVGNLVDHWQHEVLQREIDETSTGASAAATVASRAGKLTMDQIRAELVAISAAETERLTQLTAQAGSLRRTAMYGGWGLAVGAVVLGMLLANALARSLTRPLDALVAATERMTAGHVGEQVAVHTADEVGRLAGSFNRMSRELQAHQEENAAQNEELQAQHEELIAQNETLTAQQAQVNATLAELQRERDRLAHLNRFSRTALDCPDLTAQSGFMLAELIAAGGAQVGALALLDETAGTMRIEAAVGLTAGALQAVSAAGFPAEAAASHRTLAVSYPRSALLRPVYHTELPVEHELYLPIACGDETPAVAILGRTGPPPFTAHEIQWLEVLGAQAAAALGSRLAQERATTQRDNLRAILESTSEGICMVDPAGQIPLVNDRFWELTGIAPQQGATAARLLEQMRLRNADQAAAFFSASVAAPDAAATQLLELAEPAGRMLHCYTTPVPGLGRLFVVRDVTRETEVDRMKTEFISTVSHELRTPLTAIRGYVELLLDGDLGEISGEQRESLELVARSSVRLADLINDLLDVEKIESGRISMRRESVALADVLAQVVQTFRVTAAESGLGLHLTVDGPLPPVPGDADRLHQVFTNLISNGLKYTKQGDVRVSARAAHGEVIVAVADTGIGIAREHMPNLFGRFYRVDNQYTREVGGTGLGLAITKAIVERHGGRVEVDSAPGAGSTFTVRLPIIASSPSHIAVGGTGHAESPHRRR